MSDQSTIPALAFERSHGTYTALYLVPAECRKVHRVDIEFTVRIHRCLWRRKTWRVEVSMDEGRAFPGRPRSVTWQQQAYVDDERRIYTLRQAKARAQQVVETLVALFR